MWEARKSKERARVAIESDFLNLTLKKLVLLNSTSVLLNTPFEEVLRLSVNTYTSQYVRACDYWFSFMFLRFN